MIKNKKYSCLKQNGNWISILFLIGLLTIPFSQVTFAGSPGEFAVIYQYIDDSSQVHYTNDLSSVPSDKREGVVKFKEYKSNAVPENPSSGFRSPSPPSNAADFTRKSLSLKNREHKKQLEAEYNTLLKEKEDLDNNISFQKRRKKRKYQKRPYIQELIKKEEQIINRVSELEAELKVFEK